MAVSEHSAATLTLPRLNDDAFGFHIRSAHHSPKPVSKVTAALQRSAQRLLAFLVLSCVVGFGMLLNVIGGFSEKESWWPYEEDCGGKSL